MNRRFFLRNIVWGALALAACGKSRLFSPKELSSTTTEYGPIGFGPTENHPVIERDGIEIYIPPTISLTESRDRKIYMTCQFPKTLVDRLPMHPLQGALLCAIECNTQTPYCRNISKGRIIQSAAPVKKKNSFQFFFTADIIPLLELPRAGTMYFVHASCMQYVSPVRAVQVTN
jgi:hypothetical protein